MDYRLKAEVASCLSVSFPAAPGTAAAAVVGEGLLGRHDEEE